MYPVFGIETRYINKILKEVATFYASLLNQYKFKYHVSLSASFYKINEKDQRIDEIELFILLNINHNLTEPDFNNIDIKSHRTSSSRIKRFRMDI